MKENQRQKKLIKYIIQNYDLSPDDLDRLGEAFENSIMLMIDVVRVDPRGSLVMDLCEDTEFAPVIFPPELVKLLKAQDVFLAMLGWRNNRWHALYLSLPYYT